MNTSPVKWLPRSVRLLAQWGDQALRPAIEKGKYIAPLIPKRLAANIRKRSIIEGTFGSFSKETGVGWDPEWDTPRKMFILKAPRGHLRERRRPERADKVTQAMAGMEERVSKLAQEVQSRKPKKDIAFMYKRIALLAKGSRK